MPELALDDVTLHYEVAGDGPPLLLIAGMLSDSASWGPLIPHLTPHFTVVMPDNRTTGRTRPWDAPVSIQHLARDADALMRHMGHHRFHLAGHSMGGLVAMELTTIAPQALASLSILASSPLRAPRTLAVFDSLLEIRRTAADPSLWLRTLYPWAFHPGFFHDPALTETAIAAALAYPHGQSADAMAHQLEALRSYRPACTLSEIATPTLVLQAQHEILISLAGVEDAFDRIPNVTQQIVADAGHSLHWDAPQAVADHIIGFAGGNPL